MRRIFISLTMLTWTAMGAAPPAPVETIDVHIGSDSDRAAVVLLDELNKKGAEQDISFRLNEDEFTIKFIVTWRRGGAGYKRPWARVDIYRLASRTLEPAGKGSRPLFRRGRGRLDLAAVAG